MTFDHDLDLDHTLNAGYTGDHRVQVWWLSSHPPARRSDFREITNMSKWINLEIFKNFKI